MMNSLSLFWTFLASFIRGASNIAESFEAVTEVAKTSAFEYRDEAAASAAHRLSEQRKRIEALSAKSSPKAAKQAA